ncbi:MAG: response regulator, partial [Sphaerospermopsis sp. SIO1G2]|nr:response regulator [Sphaerospermopsis sp. SIO1G2]
IGYGEMLHEESKYDSDDQTVQDLERIIKSGRHLLTIVNSVLDLSKIEAGKVQVFIEAFSLPELIRDVAKSMRPLINEGGNELVIDLPDKPLPALHSDGTKLRQVLINLIGNATKFTNQGQITVSASLERELGETAFFIKVQDTGIGMSKEAVATVFDAFIQADTSTTRQYQGTGLGLTICKRFVELLGGTIVVSSELGSGSTFTIKLPEAASTVHTSPSPREKELLLLNGEDSTALSRKQINASGDLVLVVDDHAETRDAITRWLYKSGYRVQTAVSGAKAIKSAYQQRPNAMIVDFALPDMSSWDVLQELKGNPETSSIKMIFSILLNEAQKGFSFVADNYILTPAGTLEFAQKFDPLLDKHGRDTEILAIEKNAPFIDELKSWSNGRVIHTANNIDDAIQVLKQNGKCHIVVVDLEFFSESAFGIVNTIQQLSRNISLVFASNRHGIDDERHKFSTKSMMALVKSGLYEQGQWLKQLTNHIDPTETI